MAAIYDSEAMHLADGLQGSFVSDEAWKMAVEMAANRGEDVYLEDDDGNWTIHPDGTREPCAWLDESAEDSE